MRTGSVAVLITAALFVATAYGATIHVDWAGGAEVGSLGQGCADCDTPVASTTWGAIKALYR
jgi:hypothetical protein